MLSDRFRNIFGLSLIKFLRKTETLFRFILIILTFLTHKKKLHDLGKFSYATVVGVVDI